MSPKRRRPQEGATDGTPPGGTPPDPGLDPDRSRLPRLYEQMARARAFEFTVADLWHRGLISGEMHLGTGEEAVAAGVVMHLRDGDGLALAHRATPPLVVRGVPLSDLLHEFLGSADGVCGGRGGHMHLLSKPHMAASSGIVGASLPTGAGFALAASRLRPGSVGVAFTGDGAMNQGMALETLNLAAAWSLPMAIVCIDNEWAITTSSRDVTGGDLRDRARAFGWEVEEVDGTEVLEVDRSASRSIERLRHGARPVFIYATCPRLDGHFLGDSLLRQARSPLGAEARGTLGRVLSSSKGPRGESVRRIFAAIKRARRTPHAGGRGDPLRKARRAMRQYPGELEEIDRRVEAEIASLLADVPGVSSR